MIDLVKSNLGKIEELCRRHRVRVLFLVGSAARSDFDPGRSDLDFLVEFEPHQRRGFNDVYFLLREDLERLLGRHVDPGNVYDNIEAGVAYLAWLQRHTGSWRRTAMAYYQGLRSLRLRGPYTDTTAYATSVLALRGRV